MEQPSVFQQVVRHVRANKASSAVRRRALASGPANAVLGLVLGAALPCLFLHERGQRRFSSLQLLPRTSLSELARRFVGFVHSALEEAKGAALGWRRVPRTGAPTRVARPHHRCVREARSSFVAFVRGAAPDRAAALAAAVQHHLAWRTTISLSRRRIAGSSPARRSRTTSSVRPVK